MKIAYVLKGVKVKKVVKNFRHLLERTLNMAPVYGDFNGLLAAKKNYGHRFCLDCNFSSVLYARFMDKNIIRNGNVPSYKHEG